MLLPWLTRQLSRKQPATFFDTHAWHQDLIIIPTYKQTNQIAHDDMLGIWWNEHHKETTLRLTHLRAIIDKLTTTQEVRSVTFEGGNPLMWTELDQALFYLHKKKIRSGIKTDGTLPLGKSTPGTILVNLRPYLLDPTLTASITQNITQYATQKARVSLLWPIHAHDTIDMALCAVTLAKRCGLPLIAHPALLIREIIRPDTTAQVRASTALQATWQTIQAVLQTTGYNQLRLGALTPSIFPEDASFSDHPCRSCSFARATIQPDGATVSHCLALPYSVNIHTGLTLTDIHEKHFAEKIEQLEKKVTHTPRPQNCLAYQAFMVP